MSKKSPLTAVSAPPHRPSWLTVRRVVTKLGVSGPKLRLGASRLTVTRLILTWPTGWRPSTWSHSRSVTPGAISYAVSLVTTAARPRRLTGGPTTTPGLPSEVWLRPR